MVFASFLPKKGTITALPKNFAITKALGNQVAPTSYVKTFSDVSQSKWAVPQNYYPIQRIISKYYPNLSNSNMILMASKLSPIYMRNASLSQKDVDDAYADVEARRNMQKLPQLLQDKLSQIYNALTDDKKLEVLESGTPARDLGLEGEVDDTTVRRIISDAVDLGPDFKFDIPTPEGGFTSMPTYTDFATPATEFATPEESTTTGIESLDPEQEIKFLKWKSNADRILRFARATFDALPEKILSNPTSLNSKIIESIPGGLISINKYFGDIDNFMNYVTDENEDIFNDPEYIAYERDKWKYTGLLKSSGEGLKRRKKNKPKKRKVIYY